MMAGEQLPLIGEERHERVLRRRRAAREAGGPPAEPTEHPASRPPAGRLPELVDRKTLAAELGVGRATVDAIFRSVPVFALPGHRKVYVRRQDVRRLLAEHTYAGDRVRLG